MDKVRELFDAFVSGGFGAICLVLFGHPFDTVKVRLQTMPQPEPGEPPKYKSTWDCVKKTFRYEGVRGFFQGMSAPLASCVPIFAISFMGQKMGQQMFNLPAGQRPTLWQHIVAGAFSGFFTFIIMAPAERIKCLLQLQMYGDVEHQLYDGWIDCLIKLYKEGGIRSVYRGSIATLLRDIPASAVYFSTYEVIKDYLTDDGKKEITVLGTLLAGGSAGTIFWIVGLPADVLKSRYQTAPTGTYPHGIISVFVELMRIEGPIGLFRGFIPITLRGFPANAVCFVGVELSLMTLNYIYGLMGISTVEESTTESQQLNSTTQNLTLS